MDYHLISNHVFVSCFFHFMYKVYHGLAACFDRVKQCNSTLDLLYNEVPTHWSAAMSQFALQPMLQPTGSMHTAAVVSMYHAKLQQKKWLEAQPMIKDRKNYTQISKIGLALVLEINFHKCSKFFITTDIKNFRLDMFSKNPYSVISYPVAIFILGNHGCPDQRRLAATTIPDRFPRQLICLQTT